MMPHGLGSTLASWTNPDTPFSWTHADTGIAYPFTEITSRVKFDGELTKQLEGNTISWRATVNGINYDPLLLTVGLVIVQWQNIWTPAYPSQGWTKRFIGVISHENNVAAWKNYTWSREVVGINGILDRINSPSIQVGPAKLDMSGCSVTAKDTLASWEEEVDRGEFVGVVPSVDAANVHDDNIKSVWISESVPARENLKPGYGEELVLAELFFKPPSGWPSELWWAAIFNNGTRDHGCTFKDQDGNILRQPYFDLFYVGKRQWMIVCGNKALFEQYTGGGIQVASIIDASEFNPLFHLDPNDGYLGIENVSAGPVLAWNTTGASRTYDHWSGPAYNISTLPVGYSVARDSLATSFSGFNWVFNQWPQPGRGGINSKEIESVWLRLELPDNVCNCVGDIPVTPSIIKLTNYTGWFYAGGTGQGIVNGYVFNYTGKTVGGLTGVTWVNAPASPIPSGSRVYPYVDGMEQTGYPIQASHLHRIRMPYPLSYQCWWSRYPKEVAKTLDEIGWEAAYFNYGNDLHTRSQPANNDAVTTDVLLLPNTGYTWVRTLMYNITSMQVPWRLTVLPVFSGQTAITMNDVTMWPDSGQAWISHAAYPNYNYFRWTSVDRVNRTLMGVTGITYTYPEGAVAFPLIGGRGKINEITVDVHPAATGFSDMQNPQGGDVSDFIRYLWVSYLGYSTNDFVNGATAGVHKVGTRSLAINPISQIFDDLARTTSCFIDYSTDGKVYLIDDPWMPFWDGQHHPKVYSFPIGSCRGQIEHDAGPMEIDHVIVNCLSIMNASMPRPVRVVYPTPWAGTEPSPYAQSKEYNDIIIAQDSYAYYVAQSLYNRIKNNAKFKMIVKGVGEWCSPGRVVSIVCDYQSKSSSEAIDTVIVGVTQTTDENTMSVTTSLELERWR